MNDEYVIEVNNIKKHFKVYADKGSTAKEKILFWNRNKYEEKQVLNGVSFKIKRGESLGLVGHNGCGKSTTLKLLTRIMYPDEGSITIKGRVSSLLELGAGFHPDMTGIENIYINASIFGLTKKEIDAKLQDIVDFAELGDYINNPVRTYSSGMYMRLAFAVAINVDADILLIDEILAVGDVNFQMKCINKLFELKNQGITIILVSHSMDQVEKICERSIWLQGGKIQMDDTPQAVKKAYLTYMDGERRKVAEKKLQDKKEVVQEKKKKEEKKSITDRRGTGEARISKVRCLDSNDKENYFFGLQETITFEISYCSSEKLENTNFGLCIYRNDGVRCYGVNTITDDMHKTVLDSEGTIRLKFENIQLLAGIYTVDVTIEKKNGETVDYYDQAIKFEISGNRKCSGVAWLAHKWEL